MTTPVIRVVLIALGLALASGSAVAQKVYRWVDENGQVHYGDQVPPQYANQDRDILNKQGLSVGREEGVETPAEARSRIEREEREKVAKERAQHDRMLVSTYQNVEEIELLRARRIELIDSNIEIQRQSVASLKARLAEQQKRAARFQPASTDPKAQPMPEGLADDIARTKSDLHTQEANLQKKRDEREAVNAKFDADIVRFKELRGNT